MSRSLKIPTYELGDLQLLVIYRTQGVFEKEWAGLQNEAAVLDLVTIVPKAMWDDALVGLTRPLVKVLSIPPKGCLKKLPVEAKTCGKKKGCIFFDKKTCFPEASKLPWCYEPAGCDPQVAALIVAWREGKYVIVVDQDNEV